MQVRWKFLRLSLGVGGSSSAVGSRCSRSRSASSTPRTIAATLNRRARVARRSG